MMKTLHFSLFISDFSPFTQLPKRKARWLIGLLTLVAFATVLVNMPPLTDCATNPPISDHEHWFRATEVAVQPWLGRHHVYGVFMVPLQYRRHRLYTMRLAIEGYNGAFPEISPEAASMYDRRADQGQYIMGVNIMTRTALWFLFTGKFGDLTTACHWWLIVEDRKP